MSREPRKNHRVLLVFAIALYSGFSLFCQPASGCSTFCLESGDHLLFGRSYDWHFPNGMLVVNKRDMVKTAELLHPGEDKPAQWTSKYGSVTFNQYGREFPIGGMNEKGLVVETLWLFETQYPTPDDRPAVDVLTWIQYHLDTCSTVDEVIKSQDTLRITPQALGSLHYMVADASGNVVVIEFLDGKAVCTPVKDRNRRVLTNTIYAGSLEGLKIYDGFGGKAEIVLGTGNSLHRFAAVAGQVKDFKSGKLEDDVRYAFDTLDQVRWKMTQWQIVYDAGERKIYFRTPHHEPIRTIRLDAFSYTNDTPVKVFDINAQAEGGIESSFVEYTTDLNRKSATFAIRHTPHTKDMPAEALEQHVLYPESSLCHPAGKGPEKASPVSSAAD